MGKLTGIYYFNDVWCMSYSFCNFRRGNPLGYLICFIISLPIVVILVLALSLYLGTEPHQIRSTETYALTDNRIIAYKGDFCQDLRTSSTSEPMNQDSVGNLYFLKSRPPLTEHENFNSSETATLISNDNNFRYWNFYLNTGSDASFTVCYRQEADLRHDVIFYIIRGTDQLNKWIDEPEGTDTEGSYRLTSDCDTITYQVHQDGMHYFVFYLSAGSFSALNVNFIISRTLYSILPDNVLHECSFALDGSSSCALSAPMNSGYTAALSLNASRPINYADDGAEIRISCQARAWFYAVIVLVVLIVGVVIFVCGIVICVMIAIKKSTPSTSRSRGTNSAATSTTNNVTMESSFTKPNKFNPADFWKPTGNYPHQLGMTQYS